MIRSVMGVLVVGGVQLGLGGGGEASTSYCMNLVLGFWSMAWEPVSIAFHGALVSGIGTEGKGELVQVGKDGVHQEQQETWR